ncbi:MAG: type II secretion system protein GspM [Bryobacter sp.]|nr:type II secretion system protein GspM [Bryobacter sp.]
MTLTARDRRALLLLGGALAIAALVVVFTPAENNAPAATAAAVNDIDQAQRRLRRLKELIASVPGKQQELDKLRGDLATREKGLIVAETAAQAQAQLLQVVRRIARAQNPPLEFRSQDIGSMRPLGEYYGETTIGLNFDCRIEQLLNFLTDLAAQPELLATSEIRIAPRNDKEKLLGIRMAVSGVVPKRLAPKVAKGLGEL